MVLTNHHRVLTQLFLERQTLIETLRLSLTTSEFCRPPQLLDHLGTIGRNRRMSGQNITLEQLAAADVLCVRFLLFSGSRGQFLSGADAFKGIPADARI